MGSVVIKDVLLSKVDFPRSIWNKPKSFQSCKLVVFQTFPVPEEHNVIDEPPQCRLSLEQILIWHFSVDKDRINAYFG